MKRQDEAGRSEASGRAEKGLHRLHAAIGAAVIAAVLVFELLIRLGVIRENAVSVFLGLSDKPATNAEMSVHFIDVGQGDCELIICNGQACLIDCGEWDMGKRVKTYLKAQNIYSLDYFIISHQHTDHMGCADEIMEEFDIGEVIVPDIPDELIPTNSVYERFLDTADREDIELRIAERETLELGGCEIYILPQELNAEYTSLNDYSLCVKAVYGDNSFLFTGDAEEKEEMSILESGFDVSADVLKVGHHGSSGSCTEEFLNAVDPEYAVIEVGAGNDYGHPSLAAVRRLEKYCSCIRRTDENGTVVFECDGSGMNVIAEKELRNGA